MSEFILLCESAIIAFLALHTLILLHELGHLMTAELFHMVVSKVQVGIGPKLLGFEMVGVPWEWRMIPILGFVRFESKPSGEAAEQPTALYFDSSPKSMKLAVVSAGPIASAGTAAILFSASMLFFPARFPITPWTIQAVKSKSAAERAGFKAGDLVFGTRSDTGEILRLSDQDQLLSIPDGKTYLMRSVGNGGGFALLPREFNPLDLDGLEYRPFSVVYLPSKSGLLPGVRYREINSYFSFFYDLVKRITQGPGPALTSIASFSLSLAILNTLPFFPLDGGRLLTTAADGILPKKFIQAVELASLAFVIAFITSAELQGIKEDITKRFHQPQSTLPGEPAP